MSQILAFTSSIKIRGHFVGTAVRSSSTLRLSANYLAQLFTT